MVHPASVTAYWELERVKPSGPENEARFVLVGDRAKLGSGHRNDFILPYSSISKHHAEFQYQSGHWGIKNMSMSEILVNYQQIHRGVFVLLENNDIVSLVPDGSHEYRFIDRGTFGYEGAVSASATPASSSPAAATVPISSTSRTANDVATATTLPTFRGIIQGHQNPPTARHKRNTYEEEHGSRGLCTCKKPKEEDEAITRHGSSTEANQLHHCQERLAALQEELQRVQAERDQLKQELQLHERIGNQRTSFNPHRAAASTATRSTLVGSYAVSDAAMATFSSSSDSSSFARAAATATSSRAPVSTSFSAPIRAPSTTGSQAAQQVGSCPSNAPSPAGSTGAHSATSSTRPTPGNDNRYDGWQRLSASELARQVNVNAIVNPPPMDPPNADARPAADFRTRNASTMTRREPTSASTSTGTATDMLPPLLSSTVNVIRVGANLGHRSQGVGHSDFWTPNLPSFSRPTAAGPQIDHRVPSPAPSLSSNGSSRSDPFARAGGFPREFSPAPLSSNGSSRSDPFARAGGFPREFSPAPSLSSNGSFRSEPFARAGGFPREFSPAASPAPPEILQIDRHVDGWIHEYLPPEIFSINAPYVV